VKNHNNPAVLSRSKNLIGDEVQIDILDTAGQEGGMTLFNKFYRNYSLTNF